jgi:hypothetical protein
MPVLRRSVEPANQDWTTQGKPGCGNSGIRRSLDLFIAIGVAWIELRPFQCDGSTTTLAPTGVRW